MLRLEGAAAFALGLFFYARFGEDWLLFIVFFLAPDLSIPVYFVNKGVGAAVYNAVHTYAWPALLAAYGVADDNRLVLSFAIIWLAHIGLDRLLGFGLKYPTDFKQTHLQRV